MFTNAVFFHVILKIHIDCFPTEHELTCLVQWRQSVFCEKKKRLFKCKFQLILIFKD